ncbi:Na+-translocating ferredoxin:NAD+ oxidoreductase RnfC subunit [Chromobacterium alkanivorans]|uniref:4Fe-4S dicluster domain-containing protein n=1 Tax=Chromobacterium alkanivorans TaxID=1071719 RepID=UPI00216985F4|nr:Na+-translocating ferredoxin:NAD+ oxidoreductase RnfC subunit [Chromobacterium alkanivorans]MCS3817421.1 Na+-translocating ferredoxin:NAD+ oxidoreductase RnfC subunit [Chromobacterium alkanivorans]MCS3872835.1 Na+-translocating ferredoxin:NAD+ oxidoreductase RnfC subunit [Chromobacterium alkanivorans]
MTTADLIRQRVTAAGVVGAGGAGFPTAVKLVARADTYLVNGAECEPLLKVDQQLAAREAAALLRGLRHGMTATGATQGVIALKAKYREAIAALTPLLPADMRLHILEDIYPAGDEVITIWLATGRRVPPAGLPLDVGVVVSNVQTLLNVAAAVDQERPVTRRTLTVNGLVKRPLTLTLPLGTPLREALALAGGPSRDDVAFIDGGPMMGKLLPSLDLPVTKTTGGLLALPRDHLLIRRRQRGDAAQLAMARTVCEQCCLCTELCPRHLIGHELPPHLIVRAVNYRHAGPRPDTVLAALTCSECGVCEAYACPVEISPLRVNLLLKAELRAQGLRYQGELRPADPMARHRLVPVSRLITRLDLDLLNHKAPLQALAYRPEKVVLPLRQHIGAAAQPCVAMGERVREGQLIAAMPQGALGAALHASVDGVVVALNAETIVIQTSEPTCLTPSP